MLSFRKVDSTPIHVTCKFARHYGKDCKSEVHVNLDFRMSAIMSEMAVVKMAVKRTFKWEFAHISRHTGMVNCLLIEFRFAARRLENYLAYSVCSCSRSQKIFDAGWGA